MDNQLKELLHIKKQLELDRDNYVLHNSRLIISSSDEFDETLQRIRHELSYINDKINTYEYENHNLRVRVFDYCYNNPEEVLSVIDPLIIEQYLRKIKLKKLSLKSHGN